MPSIWEGDGENQEAKVNFHYMSNLGPAWATLDSVQNKQTKTSSSPFSLGAFIMQTGQIWQSSSYRVLLASMPSSLYEYNDQSFVWIFLCIYFFSANIHEKWVLRSVLLQRKSFLRKVYLFCTRMAHNSLASRVTEKVTGTKDQLRVGEDVRGLGETVTRMHSIHMKLPKNLILQKYTFKSVLFFTCLFCPYVCVCPRMPGTEGRRQHQIPWNSKL